MTRTACHGHAACCGRGRESGGAGDGYGSGTAQSRRWLPLRLRTVSASPVDIARPPFSCILVLARAAAAASLQGGGPPEADRRSSRLPPSRQRATRRYRCEGWCNPCPIERTASAGSWRRDPQSRPGVGGETAKRPRRSLALRERRGARGARLGAAVEEPVGTWFTALVRALPLWLCVAGRANRNRIQSPLAHSGQLPRRAKFFALLARSLLGRTE